MAWAVRFTVFYCERQCLLQALWACQVGMLVRQGVTVTVTFNRTSLCVSSEWKTSAQKWCDRLELCVTER